MIDEPPVKCFHTGRPARQNGNKGQITIPILGLGSRTPNPPNAPMPGACFAQRPQMRSSQETRFLLPVAALSIETRGNKRAKKKPLAKVKAGASLSATSAVERDPSITKLFLAELAFELGSAQKWLENSGARQGAKLYGAGDI